MCGFSKSTYCKPWNQHLLVLVKAYMARTESLKDESSNTREIGYICVLLCNMWKPSFLHHLPNVFAFGVCLATAQILWQFQDWVLTPPVKVQQSLCSQGAGQVLQPLQVRHGGDDVPTLPGRLVSMELCSQGERRIPVLPGVHKPEQAPQQRHGGSRPPWGLCVPPWSRVCATPLQREQTHSPTALQTQLCCGRFNTYLMRTMRVHTYGCVYICLHIHTM